MAEIFIDTNILLYSISTAPGEKRKASVARTALQTLDWGWSAQIAAEFIRASASTRQLTPLSMSQAGAFVRTWSAFPMVPIDEGIVLDAVEIAQRFQISYFDSQVVAAAKRLSCKRIYTEDLNHSQDYGGVVAWNPFL